MKITVGMATYKDFDGVYFSLASLRFYQSAAHPVEMIVVDNFGEPNPEGVGCPATKKAVTELGGRYFHVPQAKGTAAPRDLVFREATGDVVVCTDCHVLLENGTIDRLAEFYRDPARARDMVQGPLLSDDMAGLSTHFDPIWRKRMYGVWATDPRGRGTEPFEIQMQGLGMFAMRKDAWPGFNPLFKGFGGEEGYIHEKVRQRGGKVWCHPGMRWMHRFGRPGGTPYPHRVADRIANYLIGRAELGLNNDDVLDHFNTVGDGVAVREAVKLVASYGVNSVEPETTPPVAGSPEPPKLDKLKGWPQPSAIDFNPVLLSDGAESGVPAEPPAVVSRDLVSCLSATFGRGGTPGQLLLEEAIESFLRQTYKDRELLIVNDDPTQHLTAAAERVHVFNMPRRFHTLGEKLNFLAAMARGAVMCLWDDDDISLPWRLEASRDLLAGADYLNPRKEWMLSRDRLTHNHPPGNCFHSSLFTRKALTLVRGFPHNSQDTDQDVDVRMVAAGRDGRLVVAVPDELPPERLWYVYRWGIANHLSAAPDANAKYDRIGTLARPPGAFELVPKWRTDFVKMTRDAAVPRRAA